MEGKLEADNSRCTARLRVMTSQGCDAESYCLAPLSGQYIALQHHRHGRLFALCDTFCVLTLMSLIVLTDGHFKTRTSSKISISFNYSWVYSWDLGYIN